MAYYAQVPALADTRPLRVRIGTGAAAIDISGAELHPIDGGGPWRQSAAFAVDTAGALPVSISWLGAVGDTVAHVEMAIGRLQRGYAYGITIHAGGRNPAASGPSICGGPPTALSLGRWGGANDSLFIHVGGLPRGAVC